MAAVTACTRTASLFSQDSQLITNDCKALGNQVKIGSNLYLRRQAFSDRVSSTSTLLSKSRALQTVLVSASHASPLLDDHTKPSKSTSEAALILIRHGESLWNQKNLFTGCVDVPLSQTGVADLFSKRPQPADDDEPAIRSTAPTTTTAAAAAAAIPPREEPPTVKSSPSLPNHASSDHASNFMSRRRRFISEIMNQASTFSISEQALVISQLASPLSGVSEYSPIRPPHIKHLPFYPLVDAPEVL